MASQHAAGLSAGSLSAQAEFLKLASPAGGVGGLMYYVYILRSIKFPNQYYTGSTSDLDARLQKHNKGDVPHTSKFVPWEFDAFFAFRTEEKSQLFERYLKTGSGREFARRHFR